MLLKFSQRYLQDAKSKRHDEGKSMPAMNASEKPYVRIRMLGHALIAIKSRMEEVGSTRT